MILIPEWRAALATAMFGASVLMTAGYVSPAQAEPAGKKVPVQIRQKEDKAPAEKPASAARPATAPTGAAEKADPATATNVTTESEAPPKPSGRGRLSSKLGPAPDTTPAAAPATTAAPFPCPVQTDPRDGAFELGLNYGAMFPSGLVGTDQTLPTLGFVMGAPIGANTLQAQIDYGSTVNVRVLILELNMRWAFDSPYLASYFITGGHYLKQQSDTSTVVDRGAFGLTAGIGLSFALGRQVEAHFDMRGYIQSRTTILVSGGFSMLL